MVALIGKSLRLANYVEFKTKDFKLKSEARAWAEGIKADYKAAGIQLKIETNYLPAENRWEGVVLRKMDT